MTVDIDRFAQGVVETMDRRRFLRRAARGAFVVLALGTTASGRQVLRSSLGQMVVKGDTCSGPGSGCPGCERQPVRLKSMLQLHPLGSPEQLRLLRGIQFNDMQD